MIIDVSTKIWNDASELGLHPGTIPLPWKKAWPELRTTPEAHDDATACVDLSFVSGFRSDFLNAHLSSETVASFVGRAPNRRIGFAGIDPMHREAILEIDKAVSLGLSGIAISPAAQNYHPANSRAMRIYEYCEKLGLPILVEQGIHLSLSAVTLEYARPTALDEVARVFPNLKMVLCQFGSPWIDELILMVGKHANLYTDTSGIVGKPWTLYNALLRAFESGVLSKVLLASGFPFETPEQAIKRIYSVNTYGVGTELPSIPRAQLREVVERDALDCLGLQRPEGASISRGIGSVHDTAGVSLSNQDDDPIEEDDQSEDWQGEESLDSFDQSEQPLQ